MYLGHRMQHKGNEKLISFNGRLKFYVLLTVHPDIIASRKTNLMHNLFLVNFVNLYMFRAYLGPSSGGTTRRIQQLVIIILFRWLSVVLVGLDSNPTRTTDSHLKRIIITNSNSTRTTDNHLKRIISTNCCIPMAVPPDDGLRYVRNM